MTDYLYEIVPGFILAMAASVIVSLLTRNPQAVITDRHTAMTRQLDYRNPA